MLYQNIPNASQGTIIDVRTHEECSIGHVPDSVNIPWDLHLYYLRELEALPKPWIFVCRNGWLSGLVVHSLGVMGYTDLYNAGGWMDVLQEQDAMNEVWSAKAS